jgi:exopolysaccharide biosynthesis polyprenyl glycosylphosphotransferase
MSQIINSNKPLGWRLKSGERWFILFAGDFVFSAASILVAIYFWLRQDWLLSDWANFIHERVPYWFYLLPVIWILLLIEIYDVRRAARQSETLKGIGIAAGASLIIYLFVFFISDARSMPRLGVLVFIIATSIFTLAWRFFYIRVFTAPLFMRRVMVIGAGKAGSALVKVVKEIWPPPFHLIGLIDDDFSKIGTQIDGYPILGGCKQLMPLVDAEKITDLVFAISGDMSPEMLREVITAGESGVEITTMPIIYEELLNRVPIAWLQSDWVLRYLVDQMRVGGFYEILKRAIDIFGSLVGLFFMALAFPVIALAIIIDNGFPIFYSQERVGKNGRSYRMYKFRTMIKDAEKDGKPQVTIENDQRITRVGWILRKTHIDELPQFFNVLIGDMSLVGPRAERHEIMEKLQLKIPFYRARLMVRPGLTGWAQVNFGYASNAEANAIKTEYDLYYIKHRDLMLDINILLRTPGTVIGFRGQ